jgi:hypothetical protein
MLAGDLTSGNDARSAIFQGCTFDDFFDLTNGGLTATGAWARGVPQTPWTWPPMDSSVWGDRLNGYYGNSVNDTLTSPTYTASQDSPAIAFQHNFNTEAAQDGGNFAYSANGSTWTRLTPSVGLGYDGVVSALGDSGWSGNSSGWNQSVFTIPVTSGSSFWVRWRFASDATNNSYNGWLLDEVAGINCTRTANLGGASRNDTLGLSVKLSPNPVRGIGVVAYTVPTTGDFSVKLYDITGSLVARLAEGRARQGLNTAKLDANHLARGVYFVKLRSDSDAKTTKVIIE